MNKDVNLCRLPDELSIISKFPVPLAGIMRHLPSTDSTAIQPKQPERQFTNKKNTHSKNCWHFIVHKDNLSRTKISRKAHFSRVTEVVECRQMCWNLHRMQHICSRYATKILICIGHFSVEILGNVLFFV